MFVCIDHVVIYRLRRCSCCISKSRTIVVVITLFALCAYNHAANAAWTMWGGDQSHSFRSDGLGPQSAPILLWEYNAEEYKNFVPGSFIVGPQNESYVLEIGIGIVALDANGQERWRAPMGASGGGLALSEAGQLCCATSDTQSAWTTDGSQLWSEYNANFQGEPIVDSAGVMYATGAVYAANGDKIGIGGVHRAALPLGAGMPGPIYGAGTSVGEYELVGHEDGESYWEPIWSQPLGGINSTVSIGSTGTLYVSLGGINLLAFDIDGNQLWSKSNYCTPAIASDGTLRTINRVGPALACLDADGNEIWSVPLEEEPYMGRLAVDSAGTTYFVRKWYDISRWHSALTAVDSSGNTAWELELDELDRFINGYVVLGEAGALYVVNPGGSGYIRAYAVPEPSTFLLLGLGALTFLTFARCGVTRSRAKSSRL